jgi:hypothetical protein
MTVQEAAKSLHESLGQPPWLVAIGVGEQHGRPAIFLYVKSATAARKVRGEWEGYPLVVVKTGPVRPAEYRACPA